MLLQTTSSLFYCLIQLPINISVINITTVTEIISYNNNKTYLEVHVQADNDSPLSVLDNNTEHERRTHNPTMPQT